MPTLIYFNMKQIERGDAFDFDDGVLFYNKQYCLDGALLHYLLH